MGLHGVEVDEGPDDDMYMPDGVCQRDNAVRLKEKTRAGKNHPGGLGTEQESGYRTGPPGYIGWRNSFLGFLGSINV